MGHAQYGTACTACHVCTCVGCTGTPSPINRECSYSLGKHLFTETSIYIHTVCI